MRRPAGIAALLLLLLFAQGCFGPAAAPTAVPASATATRPATATSPPVATVPPSSAPTATSTARPATAVPQPATPALPTPTPTEPRLGLNPPGTPVRPGLPPGTASPVLSGREATIAQIQGTGPRSPLLAQMVRVKGVVTADLQAVPARGFFLQDREPPSSEASVGLFVYQGDRDTPDVKVGDEVLVIGVVREADDRTQIDIGPAASGAIINSSGNQLPPPIELRPPPLDADARTYFERYEGMLVSVPHAVVVGPTNERGEFTVIRADADVTRQFASELQGAGWRIIVDDEGGARYDLMVGDQVDGIIGTLDYTLGQFKVEQLPERRLAIQAARRVAAMRAPAAPDEFTVASFNLGEFFDPRDAPGKDDPCDRDETGDPCPVRWTTADYALKLTKAGLAIRDILGAPTLLAVQEVENAEVLSALAATPELAPFGYSTILLEGLDRRGLDVGLLYRRDRAAITGFAQRNACITEDDDFGAEETRCSSRGAGGLDGHYLAAHPPLLVALTVRGAPGAMAEELPLTLIINHFTARGETEPERAPTAGRRTAEARLVAGLVNEILAANPRAAVMVLGDLNAAIDSPPLDALTSATPLRDLGLDVPERERYSAIANGRSAVLDHILVTPALQALLVATTFAHFDADYPSSRSSEPTPYRVSGHDPPFARFRLP